MKFFRTHGTLILAIMMSVLCLWAMAVALNITISKMSIGQQVTKTLPAGQVELNNNKISGASSSTNLDHSKTINDPLNKIEGASSPLNWGHSKIINDPNKNDSFTISKLKARGIIFNGRKFDGLKGYANEKGELFMPLDSIIQKVGDKFQY